MLIRLVNEIAARKIPSEHVLVSSIISGTENEISVVVCGDDFGNNLPLVVKRRSDFKVFLSRQNLHGKLVSNSVFEVGFAFLSLPRAKKENNEIYLI